MSLDVYLHEGDEEVYWANITHNLNKMADAAGFYLYLWGPEACGCKLACEIVGPLKQGLEKLKADPTRYTALNAENGWGTYEQFVPWLEKYIGALEAHPKATVRVSR